MRLTTVCIFAGVLLLPGCDGSLHKDYRFEPKNINLGWGEVYAKLRGSDHTLSSGESYRGSPYELILSFSTGNEEAKGCELVLDNVSLVNVEDQSTAVEIKGTKATFKLKSDGNFKAYVSFKEISINYVTHKLIVNYHNSGNCSFGVAPSTLRVTFSKDYQERNIAFWDKLMGV